MIQVKIFYGFNDLQNFSYLIWDKISGFSWVIDPYDEKPIIDYIKKEGLVLKGILNTHQHWDHIKGNEGLIKHFKAPVLTKETTKVELDSKHKIQFVETPGHTMDHQAFFWRSEDKLLALFSGDTLFNSGVGNCKHGGDVEALCTTTMKLKKLPDEVLLYPGHDYVLKNLLFAKSLEPENSEIDEALKVVRNIDTQQGIAWSLGQEKKVNPFFRLDSEEIGQRVLNRKKSSKVDENYERELFRKLRALRDNW